MNFKAKLTNGLSLKRKVEDYLIARGQKKLKLNEYLVPLNVDNSDFQSQCGKPKTQIVKDVNLDDSYIDIKDEPIDFSSAVDTERHLPTTFESEEEDIDCIIDYGPSKGKSFAIQYLNNPLENDTTSSFCPQISDIYTTNREEFELNVSDDNSDSMIVENQEEKSLKIARHVPSAEFPISANRKNCSVCCISFYSKSDWLSHMQSLEHHTTLVSFKNKSGFPSPRRNLEPCPSSGVKVNPPLSYSNHHLKLRNEVNFLDPVPYVPLNLVKQRIIICGNMKYREKPNFERNFVSNRSKKTKMTTPKSSSNLFSNSNFSKSDSELPILFIPYKVRVKASSNGKSKLVLMYLPHFDEGTSQSYIKESLSIPPDAWIGDLVEPVKQNMIVSFNDRLAERKEEVLVTHLMEPLPPLHHSLTVPLNKDHHNKNVNSNYTLTPRKSRLLRNISRPEEEINLVSSDDTDTDTDTDTAEETEESFMHKLGLQSISSLNTCKEGIQTTKPPNSPLENKDKTIHLKAWVNRESDIQFSVANLNCKNNLKGKFSETENISITKSMLTKDKNEYKSYLSKGTKLLDNATSNTKKVPCVQSELLNKLGPNSVDKPPPSEIVICDSDEDENEGSNPKEVKLKNKTLNISIKILKEGDFDFEESVKKPSEKGGNNNNVELKEAIPMRSEKIEIKSGDTGRTIEEPTEVINSKDIDLNDESIQGKVDLLKEKNKSVTDEVNLQGINNIQNRLEAKANIVPENGKINANIQDEKLASKCAISERSDERQDGSVATKNILVNYPNVKIISVKDLHFMETEKSNLEEECAEGLDELSLSSPSSCEHVEECEENSSNKGDGDAKNESNSDNEPNDYMRLLNEDLEENCSRNQDSEEQEAKIPKENEGRELPIRSKSLERSLSFIESELLNTECETGFKDSLVSEREAKLTDPQRRKDYIETGVKSSVGGLSSPESKTCPSPKIESRRLGAEDRREEELAAGPSWPLRSLTPSEEDLSSWPNSWDAMGGVEEETNSDYSKLLIGFL